MSIDRQPFELRVREGISFSEFRDADTWALVEYLNCREVYETTLRIPFPYTEADAEFFRSLVDASTARHGHPVLFAIRNADEKLIGGFGFEGLVPGHTAEIGYWLARPFWGQGIMTDTVRAACDFALRKWNLVRITAHTFDFNPASGRVLEKNGFQFEGLLRRYYLKEGMFIDSKAYALVK